MQISSKQAPLVHANQARAGILPPAPVHRAPALANPWLRPSESASLSIEF